MTEDVKKVGRVSPSSLRRSVVCFGCLFFVETNKDKRLGECHNGNPINREGHFPVVKDNSWCGKWNNGRYNYLKLLELDRFTHSL